MDLLKGLIAIPSPPGHEDRLLDHLEQLLRYQNLSTTWIHLGQVPLDKHPAAVPIGTFQGRNLLAVWGGKANYPSRYPILFNGHVDVVPPGDDTGWSSPPHQPVVKDGCIYGNGAVDTKGGIACLLYVIQLLQANGFKPAKPLAIELVVDEERLGNGTLANVLSGISAEQVICLEPSGCDCIVRGHRGAFLFRIILRGQGCELHNRGQGSPVARLLVRIIEVLDQWARNRREMARQFMGEDRDDRAPVYFGSISGGHWFSAPLVEIHIDGVCGYLPGEQREQVQRDFLRYFRDQSDLNPLIDTGELTISLDRGFVEPCETPADSPLLNSIQQAAAKVLAGSLRIEDCANFGCDMRLRRLYDRESHCVVYGPGGGGCHQDNEYVFIEELTQFSRILAEWIIDQCGDGT